MPNETSYSIVPFNLEDLPNDSIFYNMKGAAIKFMKKHEFRRYEENGMKYTTLVAKTAPKHKTYSEFRKYLEERSREECTDYTPLLRSMENNV